MQNGITRRGAIYGLSAAPALGLLGALPSTPARAAGGWGTGPRSGLPFWLGCSNGEYDSLVALLPSGRSIDLANQWETEGPYMDVAVRNTTGWHNQKPHQYLAAGAAVQWHLAPGIGHGIDPVAMALAGEFLSLAFAGRLKTAGEIHSPVSQPSQRIG